jgi:S1-C subfamily serine protease
MEGDAFLLKELGAAIASDNGALKVLNVMPPDHRPASYKEVDLQQDDIVVMANGKRLVGTKDLQSIYDNLKIGDELKLGIKRKEEMHLVSLKKGDPKDLPKLQMKVMRGGDDDDNTATFPAVGVVMKMKGKNIVIDELLPGETAVQKSDVKTGDVLVSMNDKQFKSLKEYSEAFDKVAPGKSVTWVLRRGESEHSITFNRPQPRMMMMKREGPKK